MDTYAELEHRFAYHPPKDDETKANHQTVRNECLTLGEIFFHTLPAGREKALAITKLEEAMFWANAAIAREVT